MSASVPPQHAASASPDDGGLDVGKGRLVLGGGSSSQIVDAVVAYLQAQPAMLTITVLAVLVVVLYHAAGTKGSSLPTVNPQPLSKKYNFANRLKLGSQTKDNIISGRKKYGPDQIFKVQSLAGELVVVPPRFINEIRNDKHLLPQDASRTSVCHAQFRWSELSCFLLLDLLTIHTALSSMPTSRGLIRFLPSTLC